MNDFIYNQHDIPKEQYRYGLRASADVGCGWVATWNALQILGYKTDIPALIRYYEWQLPLIHGNTGTSFWGPAVCFRKWGFPVKIVVDTKRFDEAAKNADACILFYHWRNKYRFGAHFVALRNTAGGFVGYNTYRNSTGADNYGGSLAEFLFGDTDGIGQLAAVGVDDVNVFLGHGAGAVEHDGESGELLHNGVENVECQGRRNELAVGVAGALLGSELVCAVAGTDGDGQGVATGAGGEVDYLLGVGVGVVVSGNLILNAGENAQLTFDGNVVLVGVVNNLLGEGHVLLVGEVAAVDHHRRETVVDAALAKLEAVTVVEVQNDLGILPAEFLGVGHSTLGHIAEQGRVSVVASALGHLENNGRLLLCGGLDDGLELLHVVEVESGDCITALDGLGKHLTGVDQA